MRQMVLILAGGILFTGVFIGGLIIGAMGTYMLAEDDIKAGIKARRTVTGAEKFPFGSDIQ